MQGLRRSVGFTTRMKQEIETMAKMTKKRLAEAMAKAALLQRVQDV